MPVPYQEKLADFSRAVWSEAEVFVSNDRVRMAEQYAGKYRGWENASEQFMTMARDVKDVELAAKTNEIQRKARLQVHAGEKDISRIFAVKAQEVASRESSIADSAAA